MVRHRAFGAVAAIFTYLVDQASKSWLLHGFGLAERQPVRLLPVLDFVLAWNRGISYSLFTSDGELGRIVLLVLTLGVTALLIVWLRRATTTQTSIALGLLIGGALGNATDRFVYGAVVDFISFHVGHFSWYIFNWADVAIVVGVVLLVFESLRPQSVGEDASKLPEKSRF